MNGNLYFSTNAKVNEVCVFFSVNLCSCLLKENLTGIKHYSISNGTKL